MGMDEGSTIQWTILENAVSVASEACDRIVQASKQAVTERGEFHIVLAGGSTPERTYLMLAESDCDWKRWHLWFGDERCLPVGHPDRNISMVEKVFLSRVSVPPEQVHVIPAELGAERAAAKYAVLLEGFHLFDMVLLGMGEDGHTASLFPGQRHPECKTVLPIYEAPKFPAERVSLSAEMLSRCRSLIFIITGKRKSRAISRWRQGENLPVNTVRGMDKTEVLLGVDAWSDVKEVP